MYSAFHSSAKVTLPSVKIQLTVPHATSNNNNKTTRSQQQGDGAVAASLEALQRSLDKQHQRSGQHHGENADHQQNRGTPSIFASGNNNNTRPASASSSLLRSRRPASSSSAMAGGHTRSLAAATRLHHGGDNHTNHDRIARAKLDERRAFDLQHIQSEASMTFSPPKISSPDDIEAQQLTRQFHEFQLSKGVDRVSHEVQPKYSEGGYSAFQYALENALRRLEKQKVPLGGGANSTSTTATTVEVELSMEERWRALADCLTSLNLNQELHRVCRDVELVIEEIQKAKMYEQAQMIQQQYLAGSTVNGGSGDGSNRGSQQASGDYSSSASPSLTSPTSNTRKSTRDAKARLNGTQTAMAVMLLEQCLHTLGQAAPYAKPALTWVLDTVLGSIYVSYDIVKNDLSRSFEPLRLNNATSHQYHHPEEISSSSNSSRPNAEKLISRFYSKTFFQAVRSLSTAARAHADHAEEIERAKTRQSRVLERAISYWARYSMRRVLGAWRGFAKNEKIERDLRRKVDEGNREIKLLKDLEEQRQRDAEANGMSNNVLGVSPESLQLQVRELQRALEFERRRATRAEAALAVRVVEERRANKNASVDNLDEHGGEQGDLLRSQSSTDMTNLRAEVAHYRAVAVEACRLGDIDLHELERAVTAQTNVLARGMA